MFLIFGRYNRNKPLPPTTDQCPHCRNIVGVNWRRSYRTLHFFFFPLFSVSDETIATCGLCGFQTRGRYPQPLAPMPFLDRLGFLVPIGAGAAMMVGFLVLIGVAVATAPPPPPPTAEHKQRDALESHLALGTVHGEGQGATALANAVLDSLVKDEGLKKEQIAVAVSVRPHKVIVLCEYDGLSSMRPKARRDLVLDVRDALTPNVAPTENVVLGVKGPMFYGILAQGDSGQDWSIEIDDLVESAHVEKAMKDDVSPLAKQP